MEASGVCESSGWYKKTFAFEIYRCCQTYVRNNGCHGLKINTRMNIKIKEKKNTPNKQPFKTNVTLRNLKKKKLCQKNKKDHPTINASVSAQEKATFYYLSELL